MIIEPAVLPMISAAVAQLGAEYVKGLGGEAGKATWAGIKSLFGWSTDPKPADIREKVESALTESPELVEKLLILMKTSRSEPAGELVEKIEVREGGKVVVAHHVDTLNM